MKLFEGTVFKKLSLMLYGFGDSPDPRPDSIRLVEKIVLRYIEKVLECTEQVVLRSDAKKTRLHLDDLLFALRRDKKKVSRMEELLYLDELFSNIRNSYNSKMVGQ